MNKHIVESQKWLDESIEENLEGMQDELAYALKAYEAGDLEGCDALLQNIIKGSSVTMALISPLILLRDDETMKDIIEGGIADENTH